MTKPKVFGIGLSKTGTSSLAQALNILGYKTIHYPNDAQTYAELRNGNFKLSLLDQYDAITDTPVVPYYAQLDKLFPGSKFVLTIREEEGWLKSIEQHWQTATRYEHDPAKKEFQEFIRAAVYGCIEFDRSRFSYVYQTHSQNVMHYFFHHPEDLLVMDICNGDGWKKLCSFLSLPVPDSPFPHANEWMTKLTQATTSFRMHVPPGGKCILIDDDLLGNEFKRDRQCIPFTFHEGIYNGPPADGHTGASELDRLIRTQVPGNVIIAWPSFWWLQSYPEIADYLDHQLEKIEVDDELIIYQVK